MGTRQAKVQRFTYSALRLTAVTAAALAIALHVEPAKAQTHCVSCEGPPAHYLCTAESGPGLLATNGGQLSCITEMAKRGGHDRCSVSRVQSDACAGLAPIHLYPETPQVPETPPAPAETLADQTRPGATSPDTSRPAPSVDGAASGAVALPEDGNIAADDDAQNFPTHLPPYGNADGENAADGPPVKKAPPSTVAEMAEDAIEGSKDGVKKAGKTVGDTAKSAGETVVDVTKKTGEQIGNAGKAVGSVAKKTWDCVTSLFSDC